MIKPEIFRKDIENSLEFIPTFEVDTADTSRLDIQLEPCTIRYQFERYEDQMDVFILIDKKKYGVGQIVECEDPKYVYQFLPTRRYKGAKKLRAQIEVWGKFIEKHCQPILQGDFSFIEAYEAKKQENDLLVQEILKMSRSNPIAKKFWSGNPEWKRDLKRSKK